MSRPTVARSTGPLAAPVLTLFLVVLAAPATAQVPTEFDWRDVGGVNFVSSVKSQRQCSSCWIFSSVAMVESRWMIALYDAGHGLHEIDLSEQYILDCGSGYWGDFECASGGFAHDVLVHLRDVGAPFEDCYEYLGADGTCPTDCPDSDDPLVLHTPVVSAAYNWTYVGDAALMEEIYANGPVTTSMDVYSDFLDYSSGIYEYVSGYSAGSKSILIVGWGEESGTPYWICKNTWGPGWGEDGYFRIRRGVNECGIGEWTYTAVVAADVSATPDAAPTAPVLAQNVPNPFNPTTEIVYAPPVAGHATLTVYDVAGRRVRVLADAEHAGGREYRVTWDGRDAGGRLQPSGLYFYRLEQDGRSETRRMVMVR